MTIGGLSGKKIVTKLSFFALLRTFFLGRHSLFSPPLFLEVRISTTQLLFKPMQPRIYLNLSLFFKTATFVKVFSSETKIRC